MSGFFLSFWRDRPVVVGLGWGVGQFAASRDIYAALGLFGPLDKGPFDGGFPGGLRWRMNFFHLLN